MRILSKASKLWGGVLGAILVVGGCGAPGAPVGVTQQADSPLSYIFRMERMNITNTRSRVTDTDFAAIAVGVDGQEVGRAARYVGDYNNGNYPVDLSFGPFTVNPNSQVSIAYSIDNKAYSHLDFGSFAEFVAAFSVLAATATNAYLWFTLPEGGPLFSAVLDLYIRFIGFLFANCDGPVVVGKLNVDGATLYGWTRYVGTRLEWHDFPGVDSPAGCGSNSRYQASWSITQVGWAPVCGDSVCSPGETCSSCPQDCGFCPVCGNGICEPAESCESCPQDCGQCPRACPPGTWDCCGDGSVCCTSGAVCP
jgi:hypothetical protein